MLLLPCTASVALGEDKNKTPAPVLDVEHKHPSGAFSFRTPASWKVEPSKTTPENTEVSGDNVHLRFVYRPGESGYDSLHVTCMLERLAGAMDTAPAVKYEYDFIGGEIAERHALDSAFVVNYDKQIEGYREWRQRNVTIVGKGHSLCIITYVPVPLWKKSRPTRALVDAVLASVTLP